jgi:hypothetical protein
LNCSESGGLVTCTGPENIVGEVIACNECDDSITSLTVPAGAPHCPPGMYFDGKICIGDGEPGRCPKGYTYRIDTQCCEAGPGIPYPGCGPDEYYNGQICVPGQKPKEGSCTSILVGVGNCGGDNPDGGDTPPTGICPPGQTYFCPQTAPGPCFCR